MTSLDLKDAFLHIDTQVVQEVLTFLLERTKLPVPRTNVWSVTEPPYLHKNPAPSSELGTNPENQGSSILGRPDNSRGVVRSMRETHKACTFEANQAGIFDKNSQVGTDPLSENHTPWYDHRQPGHVLESSNDKDSRPTARRWETDKRRQDVAQRLSELYMKGTSDVKPILVDEFVMDIDGLPIRRRSTESTYLEGPFEEMEWSVVPVGNSRSRGIHICERDGLGYRHWPQKLLWLMEKIRGYTPHQLQGAACSSICLATERNCEPVSSDLLRQYDHPSICKEIWWNYLTRTSQHSGTPVGALREDEYQASSHECYGNSEPSGCIEPNNCTDRVVNFEQDILSIEQEIREARRRTHRIRDQQEGTKILQLVPGPTICRPERVAIQLVELEEPVLQPILEPDFTCSPEGETRADYYYSNYTCMNISDLFSGHATLSISQPQTLQATEVVPDPKSGKSPLTKNKDWTLMALRFRGAPSKKKVSLMLQSNLS
ncbi:hypothetical protein AYI69_g4596 [Smittium culicis]|uniref:Uncharacterized protein n=1 Tax=Smittium culicis TaxID=133412 RepID=A0A1R1YCB6_9FUNG|nr:hypothetical protein AYI69_g4596 [Smittium culicis]